LITIVTTWSWNTLYLSKYSRILQNKHHFYAFGAYLSQERNLERDLLLSAFSKRLQQAVDESSFAKQEQGILSAQIGVSRQALRKWLEAKALPSQTRLPVIANLLKVDLAWLATGEGKMHSINAEVFNENSLKKVQFSLNIDEVNLLKNYRKLSTEIQKLFYDIFSNITTIKS